MIRPGPSWVETPGSSNVWACVFFTWPHRLNVILGILLISLSDLDSFQSLLPAGNKYLIKVHYFFLSWNFYLVLMAIFKTVLVNVHFITCIFLKFHAKMQALNILKGAQALVLELYRIEFSVQRMYWHSSLINGVPRRFEESERLIFS